MVKPLVPPEVDLRGMPFMPLDVGRLRDSRLAIRESGDVFRAAVLLWCASWTQIPAASLPDDDIDLAAYAGARDMKSWKKVKEGAMRGFVLCDDGRWYHPVVAQKAMEAWAERKEYRAGKQHDNERKKNERRWRQAAFKALSSVGVTPAWNIATGPLRALVSEHGVTVTVTGDDQPEDGQCDGADDVTEQVTQHVTVTGHGVVTAKTGTGTGTGTGILKAKEEKLAGPDEPGSAPPASKGSSAITIGAWLERLRERDEPAIPDGHAVFAYADSAGIPPDFVELAWQFFRDDRIASGKRQKDWRKAFLNAVKGNWHRLWWIANEGDYRLTTAGIQARNYYEQQERSAA